MSLPNFYPDVCCFYYLAETAWHPGLQPALRSKANSKTIDLLENKKKKFTFHV
jgi:hypothetical protein